jgi:hypothetical protein
MGNNTPPLAAFAAPIRPPGNLQYEAYCILKSTACSSIFQYAVPHGRTAKYCACFERPKTMPRKICGTASSVFFSTGVSTGLY